VSTCHHPSAHGLAAVALLAALALTGCAHRPGLSHATSVWNREAAVTNAATLLEVRSLQAGLSALGSAVQEDEAHLAARCAIEYSRQLAAEYRVVRPALFHNFLVNTRFKKRGLCFQWTEDLLAQLQSLHLSTLDLHWGIARAGTPREHNSVVVTAHGQPFEDGLVLDPWRSSGRLTWTPVTDDKYPWEKAGSSPAPQGQGGELPSRRGKSVFKFRTAAVDCFYSDAQRRLLACAPK
jgi:hypothetical protein